MMMMMMMMTSNALLINGNFERDDFSLVAF